MPKKKKKNKKSPVLPTDPVLLENLMRREYAAGWFSRARDAYKQLHKRDPEKNTKSGCLLQGNGGLGA